MNRIVAAALLAAVSTSVPARAQEPAPPAARPPPAQVPSARRGTTGICGVVVDGKSGETLIEAPVAVVKGGAAEVRTDVDGNFTLPLAPGLYDVRARYELYQARRVNGITVVAGECTRLTIELSQSEEAGVDEVVVTARKDTRREATVLAERKVAAVVQDSISAQEISRTPDGVASDAVKRVVSATIVDGKYVYLRGLGGRYSSVLVNGVTLPSPDPDEYAVPLDLFPTSLLAQLNVAKTWTPELPGSFAGGTLQIETTPYPSRFETKLGVSLGADTRSTLQTVPSAPRGGLDLLGFDDGGRALPGAIPRHGPLDLGHVDAQTLERAGEAVRNVWSAKETRGLPALGLSASLGDTRVFRSRKLGYLVSLDYGVKETERVSRVAATGSSDEGLVVREQVTTRRGTLAADLSGLANVGFELGPDDDVSLLLLYTHSGESRAEVAAGESQEKNGSVQPTRLQFISRGLAFAQLRGASRFSALGDLDLDWQANGSWVTRDEPDTSDVNYLASGTGAPTLLLVSGSGERFFSELQDLSGGGSLELKVPAGPLRIRSGASAQVSRREFRARRFRFTQVAGQSLDRTLTPEQIFTPGNIGPKLEMKEYTLQSDGYDGAQEVYAAYAVGDATILPNVRAVAGLRVESSHQEIDPGTEFAVDLNVPDKADRRDTFLLPAANLTWSLVEGMNLRAAYSYTLARPQFRELAPYIYFDFARRRSVTGNPELEVTRIQNGDLRWEWFPGEDEVVAASVFYKRFEKPIELTIQTPTQGDLFYENAPAADTYGAELEVRSSLGRFAAPLGDFRAGVNVTLVRSQVDFQGQKGTQTSSKRPLQGQSPYVINGSLSWARGGREVSLLYNVYGKRIAEVGNVGLPDVYEQPFHRLDLAASQQVGNFKAKLALTNLFDSEVVMRQGRVETLSYRSGLSGSLSLEWSH